MDDVNIEAAARNAVQQLRVTDSAVTAQNLGKVIRETYGFYLSRSEVDGIIAMALAISKQRVAPLRENRNTTVWSR